MACRDCFRNCPQKITDLCIEYTGDSIPELDICTGDTLLFVEANIIAKLLTALDGTGITITDFVNCPTITTLLDGQDANIANLVQALVTNACSADEAIQGILTTLNAPFSIPTSCLTLPTSPTRDDVLKATVIKVCENTTKIDTVFTDYVKSSELCDKVEACIDAKNAGNGGSIVQENTKMAKYVYMAYDGPLTVFDSSGKGILSAGYDKVYIANGNHNTKDLRGYGIMGANTNVVGGTLANAVDPSQSQNAGYSMSPGAKKGSYTDTLTVSQIPSLTFPIPPLTYNVKIPGQRGGDNSDNANTTAFAGGDKLPSDTGFNFTLTVPVTTPASNTSPLGGGQPHNTLQPTYAAVWIIYLP